MQHSSVSSMSHSGSSALSPDLVNCEAYGDAMSDRSRRPLERQRACATGCVLGRSNCDRSLCRVRAIQRDLTRRCTTGCVGWRAAAGERNVSCEAVDGRQGKRIRSRMSVSDCSRCRRSRDRKIFDGLCQCRRGTSREIWVGRNKCRANRVVART